MNMKRSAFLILTILFVLCVPALAQTSAFTYQGKLADGGVPANGAFDLTFRLFNASVGGSQIGADVVVADVQVTDGVFTVVLDFGAAAFSAGEERFLQINVRPGSSGGAFTPMLPLQPLTS
jgi:hypothetical protein